MADHRDEAASLRRGSGGSGGLHGTTSNDAPLPSSSAALPSPTEIRTPLSRFDSNVSRDDSLLSESFQSTDTVRRRPETYGTISQAHFDSPQDRAQRPPATPTAAAPAVAAAVSSTSATRSPLLGPERSRARAMKPPMPRRTSSNTRAPHRGGVFSVDDAASEVEADEALRSHGAFASSLRRRPPTASLAGSSRLHQLSLDDIDQGNEDESGTDGAAEQHEDGLDAEGSRDRANKLPTGLGLSTVATPRLAATAAAATPFDPLPESSFHDAVPGADDNEGSALHGGSERGDRRDFGGYFDEVDDADEGDMDDTGGFGNSGGGGGGGGSGIVGGDGDDDDDDNHSDAESFTLKDRQQAINETHPFGIRLWKPALYKKDRSVQKTAEGDIHSSPGGHVSAWLLFFNVMWTLCFGFWLALLAFLGAVVCLLFAAAPSGREYGRVLWGLSGYLLYPFGKFVRLEQQEPYLDEDEGEGRSISEYEQWQNGDLEYGRLFFGPDRGERSIVGHSRRSIDSEPSETDSLLQRVSRQRRRRRRRQVADDNGHGLRDSDDDDADDADSLAGADQPRMKRRLFGRGQWNVGRVIFFLFFYLLITPALFIVSGICWFLVFWIPMGRVSMLLFDHLRRHPLALSFESDIASARAPAAPQSSIIVCTYRAVGLKYWKYTVDGTNIFLINLMAVVIFVIFDWLVLDGMLHYESVLTSSAFLFVAGLLSIIPLAYFIGQAVASISAQSSMGVGAAINAFFSTIVEVFLYTVALDQGKAQLVEGSIIGSIFAGILFLPGISMCFGAIKRKTQRFNARSAGVTSTMLLFAVIGAFSPTLFYQIYGTHELNCLDCVSNRGNGGASGDGAGDARDCRRCYFSQSPRLDDRFYLEAVRPYCYVAASLLFLSYAIGLWFTLRTHAAVIWNTEIEEKRHEEQQQQQQQHQQQQLHNHQQQLHQLQQQSQQQQQQQQQWQQQSQHGHASGHAHSHHSSTGGAASSSVDIRDSLMYRRILGQSLRQMGLQPRPDGTTAATPAATSTTRRPPSSSSAAAAVGGGGGGGGAGAVPTTPHVVPPKLASDGSSASVRIPGLTDAENSTLVRQVAEMAATAAAFAARDVREGREGREGRDSGRSMRRSSAQGGVPTTSSLAAARGGGGGGGSVGGIGFGGGTVNSHTRFHDAPAGGAAGGGAAADAGAAHGGHDAPNWSRLKSSVVLMVATALYAIIAEILVDSVDFVLEGFSIDQKFLGITLFALVPNTTEFLNAISFAMNGNISLSMEIGSAYALQVCLLQIPALVLYSAVLPVKQPIGGPPVDVSSYMFSLLFPQWDMVTVILCVFLLSYMYGEGKSNYFKGSILLLSYLVVVVGYYFSSLTNMTLDLGGAGGGGSGLADGASRFDTLGSDGQYVHYGRSFLTVGQGRSGPAVY